MLKVSPKNTQKIIDTNITDRESKGYAKVISTLLSTIIHIIRLNAYKNIPTKIFEALKALNKKYKLILLSPSLFNYVLIKICAIVT